MNPHHMRPSSIYYGNESKLDGQSTVQIKEQFNTGDGFAGMFYNSRTNNNFLVGRSSADDATPNSNDLIRSNSVEVLLLNENDSRYISRLAKLEGDSSQDRTSMFKQKPLLAGLTPVSSVTDADQSSYHGMQKRQKLVKDYSEEQNEILGGMTSGGKATSPF